MAGTGRGRSRMSAPRSPRGGATSVVALLGAAGGIVLGTLAASMSPRVVMQSAAAMAALGVQLAAQPSAAAAPSGAQGRPGRQGPPPSRVMGVMGLQKMSLDGREIQFYMAKPEGEGTWPGVVLAHGGWGIDREFKQMVDRLSAEGFVVMVPDLNGGKTATDEDKARELGVLMDEESAVAALDAVVKHLKYVPEVGDHRVGLVGFDSGGRVALKTAMVCTDISALVVAYARPITEEDALRRVGPPILALYGGADPAIPVADVEAFRAALSNAGRTAEVKVYDGAGRAFMNENASGYDAGAAGDAWSLAVSFLRSHL